MAKLYRYRLMMAAALTAALAFACGDDDGGGSKPPGAPGQPATAGQQPGGGRAPAGGAAAPARRPGGKKEVLLKLYPKVEDRADPKEAAALRRRFRPEDFANDLSGNDNRDPFRSYVIRQVLTSGPDRSVVAETETCTEHNMRAPNPLAQDPRARKSYSLRDLRLGALVLRQGRSYAMFVDSSNYGHTVRLGDCVGKEKARVTKIGAGFVTLEVTPEQGSGGAVVEPQERKIELHPEELQLDEEIYEQPEPTPTPPATGTAPAGGQPKEGSADQP